MVWEQKGIGELSARFYLGFRYWKVFDSERIMRTLHNKNTRKTFQTW